VRRRKRERQGNKVYLIMPPDIAGNDGTSHKTAEAHNRDTRQGSQRRRQVIGMGGGTELKGELGGRRRNQKTGD